jgi:hypothetical protein
MDIADGIGIAAAKEVIADAIDIAAHLHREGHGAW